MSGHSKWSQIKRQKGAADIKRGAIFSKLTNAIIIAARNGGDPNANFQLKMTIEKARFANMPKDTTERAIKRGTGEISGAKIEEVLYEAIYPGNVGILIEALTDNRNRTNSEIKNVLGKFGAKLVSSGAVAYQFKRMGKLLINTIDQNREEIELKVIDAGAQDLEEQGDVLAVYVEPHDLELVKKALEHDNVDIKEAGLSWEPKNLIAISDKIQTQKVLSLMEAIDNLEDVTAAYSNFDLQKEIL